MGPGWPGLLEGDCAVSPPARGTRWRAASASSPSRNPSSQAAGSRAGTASERKTARGLAPMAARSLRPRARQRCPADWGGCQSRRKWTFLREKSVVTQMSWPAKGRRIAQSSPMPSRRVRERAPARRRMASMSASSPGMVRDFRALDVAGRGMSGPCTSIVKIHRRDIVRPILRAAMTSSRTIRVVLRLIGLMAAVAGIAQTKWAVPDLQELARADQIGSGRTPLSPAEVAELRQITGPAIRAVLSGSGDPTTFARDFNSFRIERDASTASDYRAWWCRLPGDCMCGAVGNCDFWLIAEKSSGFEVVLETRGVQTFAIEKTPIKWLLRRNSGSHDSASDMDLSLYHYTGQYYRRSACALMSYQGDHFEELKVPRIMPKSCRGH